ncbi:MAG: hypothetical protein A3K66_07245 [Euryarchaeota archaeon RBG_16_67_27]|nr:MAG: hypothetical protein A3K66_07245 [Euryarchaeota archaeon RBG_16_67_27]
MSRESASGSPAADADLPKAFPIRFDPEKGRIFFQDQPVWLMSPQHFAALAAELESTFGESARAILVRVSKDAGRSLGERMVSPVGAATDDMSRLSALLRIAEILPAVGHGKATFIVKDLKDVATVWTLPHSWIADLRKPGATPVCGLYAGYLAGILTGVFARPVACEEVECRALGAKACVFRTRAT